MSNPIKKLDAKINTNELFLVGKMTDEHKKAAIYTVLEDVYETTDPKLSNDSNKSLLGKAKADDVEETEDTSSEDSNIELFSGKNFYMNNGNPFEMFMELLTSRAAIMKISNELKSYTELAQGGLSLNTDGTVSGDGSKGFATLIADSINEAASQQAIQTGLDAAQSLSAATSDIVGAIVSNGIGGNADDEQNNVDKLENALSKFDSIESNPDHITTSGGSAKDQYVSGKKALLNNKYDFTKEGQEFGSVEETQTVGLKKKTVFKKDDQDDSTYNKEDFMIEGANCSVEDAIAAADPSEREQMRKNITSSLDDAKKTLEKSLKAIDGKKESMKKIIDSLGRTAGASVQFAKQANILAQGKAEAEKQVDQTLQGALSSVEQTSSTAYKNSQDTLQGTLSELQGIMRNIRTGG